MSQKLIIFTLHLNPKNWGVKYCRLWLKYYGGECYKNPQLFHFLTKKLKIYQNSFRKIKKTFWRKNFLEPYAFLDKQYCKNWWACNFFFLYELECYFFLNWCGYRFLFIIQKSFRKIKKTFWTKNFLEPYAFLDKQYCKNWWACNFFAIWVRILFFKLTWIYN